MEPTTHTERTPRLTVHVNDERDEDTLRTPVHHLRRAVRALRHGWSRARRELEDGVARASVEVRHAATSVRAGWRSDR